VTGLCPNKTSPMFQLSTLLLFFLRLSLVAAAATEEGEDAHELCWFWATEGECDANPNYMLEHCRPSCRKQTEMAAADAREQSSAASISDDWETETVGIDGLPFNMEVVRARMDDEKSCGSTTTTTQGSSCSQIVRLPEKYDANITLSPPLGNDVTEPTLEELHARGVLTNVNYIHRGRRSAGAGVAVKLINFSRRTLKEMWDDGSSEGVYNGEIGGRLGDRSVLTTYAGHSFNLIDKRTGEFYRRLTMKNDIHYIVLEPDPDDSAVLNSEKYVGAKREEHFMRQYYQHYGYPWLATYGRPAPVLNMWPAEYLGQTHTIRTRHGHWICDDPTDAQKCHTDEALSVDLTVANHADIDGPRVFVIPDLMSDAECDHILRLGKSVVRDSMVGQDGGGFKSQSRTSSTGWLDRATSPILQTLHRRFADVLGLDDARLHEGDLAEQLQVVRYEHGQLYFPHHDFGEDGTGYGQRFLTLLLYVVVPEHGGHTSFPKAFGGRGMRVKPPRRGGAVLFYDMLPDGNGDDLSLHGGDSVNGDEEKWVCNLWVWDPDRSK